MTDSIEEISMYASQLTCERFAGIPKQQVIKIGRKFLALTKETFWQMATGKEAKQLLPAVQRTLELLQRHKVLFGFDGKACRELLRYEAACHHLLYPEKTLRAKSPKFDQLLQKWTKECAFPLDAFHLHPDLSERIFETFLHQAMRYFQHTVRLNPETKELELLIDGSYQAARKTLATIVYDKSREMLVDRSDPNKVWTYTEKGLVVLDSTKTKRIEEMAQLRPEEVAYAQAKAKMLMSPKYAKEGGPCYVFEIASSWKSVKAGMFDSGQAELMRMPRHPWIRFVTPEGSLESVGFWPARNLGRLEIAKTIEGEFRSPERWEVMPYTARIVTRIAVTEEEYASLKQEIETFYQKGIVYNAFSSNCASLVRHLLHRIAIVDARFDISLGELLRRSLPSSVQKVCRIALRTLKPVMHAVKWLFGALVPEPVRQISHFVLRKIVAIASNSLVVALLSGLSGLQSYSFSSLQKAKRAIFTKVEHFFDEKAANLMLPRAVIEWQMQKSSTTAYPRSVGLYGQYGRPAAGRTEAEGVR